MKTKDWVVCGNCCQPTALETAKKIINSARNGYRWKCPMCVRDTNEALKREKERRKKLLLPSNN